MFICRPSGALESEIYVTIEFLATFWQPFWTTFLMIFLNNFLVNFGGCFELWTHTKVVFYMWWFYKETGMKFKKANSVRWPQLKRSLSTVVFWNKGSQLGLQTRDLCLSYRAVGRSEKSGGRATIVILLI